jgi:hypothetical protein
MYVFIQNSVVRVSPAIPSARRKHFYVSLGCYDDDFPRKSSRVLETTSNHYAYRKIKIILSITQVALSSVEQQTPYWPARTYLYIF